MAGMTIFPPEHCTTPPPRSCDEHDDDATRRRRLEQTLRSFDAAIRALTTGDPEPYVALLDDDPDATLFGAWMPLGRGPQELRETAEWVAGRVGPDGGTAAENVIVQMSGSLAYTVGFERGMIRVDGGPLAPTTFRVTHVYRYANGRWRIVHRHADVPPADQRPGARTS